MRPLIFPDIVYFRAPDGTKSKARKLAKRLRTSQAEILRQSIHAGLSFLEAESGHRVRKRGRSNGQGKG